MGILCPPHSAKPWIPKPPGTCAKPALQLTCASVPPPVWPRALPAENPTASSRGRFCEPVARDILAARKPGTALGLHMLQRLRQATDPRRPADDPRV